MKKFVPSFVFALGAVALTMIMGCSSKPVAETDNVATWGDTAMTVAQFKDKMMVRFASEAASKNRPYADRVSVIQEYVLRDCKLLEGRRLGLDKRPDIQKSYQSAIDNKVSDLVFNRYVRDRVVTDAMIDDYAGNSLYDVRARHLLINMDEKVKGKDTLQYWNKINDVWQKAKAGEDFQRLIDRYSEDDTIDKSAHGDLGYFYWGKMVDEFQDAAWKLKPGEISPPVRSTYGYHLIQCIDRRSVGLEANTAHILIDCSRRATPAETTLAYNRALEALTEAQKKGMDFAQVARKYSEDRKTWENGDIGWTARGTMPEEYWNLVFTMKPGDIGGPVRSYKGYHIIKVKEIRDNPPTTADKEFRERVISRLARIHQTEVNSRTTFFSDSVKKAYGQAYDQKVVKMLLDKLGDKSVPTNMNPFSALTEEQRQMNVLNDKLGGVKITDLADMYGDHRFIPTYRNETSFITEMVDPIAYAKYLSDIAQHDGTAQLPEVIEDGVRNLDNALLPAIEQEMVFNKNAPTEDMIQAYYKKNVSKYGEAATATVFEIQVDTRESAKDMLDRINKGEDISKLARRYTQRSIARTRGGRLGPFEKDKYGAMSMAAFNLDSGKVAGPIEAEGKFSIIQLIEKSPAKVKELEEVRPQVENDVRFDYQKKIREDWENELRKFYKIKYDLALVKRVWPIVQPLPQAEVDKRKKLEEQRTELAKKKSAEDQIQLKLKPNSEQEFTTKEGKKVSVKIGEPKYMDKQGNPIDPKNAPIKLTQKGTMEKAGGGSAGSGQPNIKITPVGGAKPKITITPKGQTKPVPGQPTGK